jgi:DNA polymerase-1
MQEFSYRLNGEPVRIHYPESADDLGPFFDFTRSKAARGAGLLGCDTETTGLNPFARDFRVRLVQFGDARRAFVLRADMFDWAIRRTLEKSGLRFIFHNAQFDCLSLERTLGVGPELLASSIDTQIMAHLVDPRGKGDGEGVGHRLKELARKYVAPEATDGQSELVAEFRKMKLTKANGFARIPIDHPAYVTYAGLDPILTFRLYEELAAEFRQDPSLQRLARFEHELATACAGMVRRGLLVDVPYAQQLAADLEQERDHFAAVAARLGVENVNSGPQIAAALMARGHQLTEKTDKGAWKTDKAILQELADLTDELEPRDPDRRGDELADAILRAKRAGKWRAAYAGAFLSERDEADRIHPTINTLAARTGRMSVSGIPLQQLPSKEWKIRRAIVADPGNVIVSIDYSQIELVMLAALSQDPAMLAAARAGEDMHSFAARQVFGPDFTPKQRKLTKAVSLGRVYGGGAQTIQRQTGAPMDGVLQAIRAYDERFPGVREFSNRLSARLDRGELLRSPTGRRLPVDEGFNFRAVNYMCQSTARDVLASALLDVAKTNDEALLLPIHDELLVQVPAADAAELAKEIEDTMTRTLGGTPDMAEVTFRAEAEVGGRSWGSLYGAPEELEVAA